MTENHSNNNYISSERTEAITLSDVDLSIVSVTFTETKQGFDSGMPDYDLDFYTATHEYGYETSAQTGAIVDKSIEVNKYTVREIRSAATAAPTVVVTEASRDFIGVDRAKSTASGHAGASTPSVLSSKAKLDDGNGRDVCETKFHMSNIEYDYGIDAHSGAIPGAGVEND